MKPDNFAMGRKGTRNRVYIFDFGLSKKYMSPTGDHVPYREGGHLVGTARFASINTHRGIEQSRRDDLESLCYTLIYLTKGRLPWQNITGDDKYLKILAKKSEIEPEELCSGIPVEFMNMLKHCRELKFDEEPDYDYLKG